MYWLIKKDFLLQKKSFWLSLIIISFLPFTLSGLESAGFVMSILCVCYLFVFGASAHEDKSRGDVLLNSMPIRKTTIVLSKYASIYVFAAFGLIVNFLLSMLGDLFHIPRYGFPITLESILAAFMAVTVLFSISLPMIFKLGFTKARIVNFILFFGILVGTNMLSNRTNLAVLKDLPDLAVKGLALAGTVILLIVSCLLSLYFYRNREFG
jgi:hypothetical protein